ncbi:MAG: nuoH [Chitinophagaceae bacterium]|nr:nuoH [Chitinophagaceae bacterium]
MEIFLLDKTIVVVIVFLITLLIAMYSTWAERKVAGFIQDRIGPNRAGIFGILQPLADGVKMFMKEEIIPTQADKALFIMAPGISMLTALLTSSVIPWGSYLEINGRQVMMQITDINIGMLYIFAVVSTGVYGIMIGGWSSNNKYSLMGALRASSQMISYELALGLALISVIMMTETLSLKSIVEYQAINGWNIIYQPLGFLIFFICALAECNRTPFDLPESEAELIGGYHTEYSSMKLGLFLFAEYVNMFISGAIMSALFFGGYNLPFHEELSTVFSHNTLAILGTVSFMLKTFTFIFIFMWIRWTVPRFRYDQLMHLGWKILLPLAMFNVVATGTVILIKMLW